MDENHKDLEEIETLNEQPKSEQDNVVEVAPMEENNEAETPVEVAPMEENNEAEAPVEVPPMEENNVAETSGDVAPMEENNVAEAPVEVPPMEENNVAEAPVEVPPMEENNVAETPVEEPPMEENNVVETPVEVPSMEENNVAEAPVEETPMEENNVVETPVEEPPMEENNVAEAPVEETPMEENNVAEAPGEVPPMEENNVAETPVEVPPMEENNEMMPNNSNKKKGKFGKVFLIILLILVLIAAIIIVVLKFMPQLVKKDATNKIESKKVYSKYRMDGNGLQNFDLSFLKIENSDNNIIYSPLSIKYALGMLNEGASGNTKKQITDVIGDYKINKYTNNNNMSFANALFIRDNYKEYIKTDYKDNLTNKYNAELIYDSFQTPNNVNKWVSDKTFGLIDQLVDNVSNTKFMLINALAIDMEWNKLIQATNETFKDAYSVHYEHENFSDSIRVIMGDIYSSVPFNNNQINAKAVEIGAAINNYDIISDLGEDNIRQTITQEYTNWLANGDNLCGNDLPVDQYVNKFIEELKSNYGQVKSSTDFMLYNDEHVKAFAKDLKEYSGTTLQYVGIMPKDQDINQYIENVDTKNISDIITNLKTIELGNFTKGKVTEISGYIPLFKYDYELKLNNDLNELGITDIFDKEKIDLSNMTSDKDIVMDTKHKANIEFSNEGIKAAAATMDVGFGAARCGFEHLYEVPVEKIDLTFDKPYIFLIRDKNSGEIWFVGKVIQPTENNTTN